MLIAWRGRWSLHQQGRNRGLRQQITNELIAFLRAECIVKEEFACAQPFLWLVLFRYKVKMVEEDACNEPAGILHELAKEEHYAAICLKFSLLLELLLRLLLLNSLFLLFFLFLSRGGSKSSDWFVNRTTPSFSNGFIHTSFLICYSMHISTYIFHEGGVRILTFTPSLHISCCSSL